MSHNAENGLGHPFALVLDEQPINGHIFGTLSIREDRAGWIPVERRCSLCNRLPIELLTIDGATAECEGPTRVLPPAEETPDAEKDAALVAECEKEALTGTEGDEAIIVGTWQIIGVNSMAKWVNVWHESGAVACIPWAFVASATRVFPPAEGDGGGAA